MKMVVRKGAFVCGIVILIFVASQVYRLQFEDTAVWQDPEILPDREILPTSTSTPEVTPETQRKRIVLLMTYLRSGSTLTADIIQQASGAFYAYEPLKMFVPELGYLMKNRECQQDNYCQFRNTTSLIRAIKGFYRCDLQKLTKVFSRLRTISYPVSVFNICRREYNYAVSFCMMQVERLCQISKLLSIKTIRMSMDMVEELLQEFPTLKIVHLLRDPRGMLASRRRGGFIPEVEIRDAARGVCNRFITDIKESRRLRQLYPGRIKTVLYEAIAEKPLKMAHTLYKFINVPEPANLQGWIHKHTAAGESSTFYDTVRPNSTYVAYKWRRFWNISMVKKIDSVCGEYYHMVGLRKIRDNFDLKNLGDSVRIPNSEFGYYFDKDTNWKKN